VHKACTDDGSTPLHAATLDDHRSVAQLLLVFGANMAATATFEASTRPHKNGQPTMAITSLLRG
jgi:hypothetical protein